MADFATEANGLYLSNSPTCSSGYDHVAVVWGGAEHGKFAAYADVPENLQAMKKEFLATSNTVCRQAYGHANHITLGIFDDVRDAAYVAQMFAHEGGYLNTRDDNLQAFFAGDTSVIATPPAEWQHPPHPRSAAAVAFSRKNYEEKVAKLESNKRGKAVIKSTFTGCVKDADKATAAMKYLLSQGGYALDAKDLKTIGEIRTAILAQRPTTNEEFVHAAMGAMEFLCIEQKAA